MNNDLTIEKIAFILNENKGKTYSTLSSNELDNSLDKILNLGMTEDLKVLDQKKIDSLLSDLESKKDNMVLFQGLYWLYLQF